MSHPSLKKIHWLPISYGVQFKYNLLTFKAISFSQPPHLSSLIKSSSLTNGNRLSFSLISPKKVIGRYGFAKAAPVKWDRLPYHVQSQLTIFGLMSQPVKATWHTHLHGDHRSLLGNDLSLVVDSDLFWTLLH